MSFVYTPGGSGGGGGGGGITSINSDTSAAQIITAGTAGSDVAVVTSGGTTTIRVPTASASNRGALSSTDWSTFNSKLTGTLADGKIFVGNGSNVATAVTPSGDVTITNAGVTAVGSNKITLGMMAQMATANFLGRTTASTGNVESLTATQATALLNNVVGDSGSGGTKGLVPAPASGDAAAGKFLKADGTWTAPSGGSGVTTMAAVGSSPNANAASISGSTLTMQPADGSNPGVVTTASQTFAGLKTFSTGVQFTINDSNVIDFGASNFNIGTRSSKFVDWLIPTTGAWTFATSTDAYYTMILNAGSLQLFTPGSSSNYLYLSFPNGTQQTINVSDSLDLRVANTAHWKMSNAGHWEGQVAGKGIRIKEGSNARMGVSTLVGGTVTVSNTSVTSSTRIFLTAQNNSGTVGAVSVSGRSASTSFTITSTSALDTSDIAWFLMEPS